MPERTDPLKENKIILTNRQNLSISGVEKVISISETILTLEAYGSGLVVNGSNLLVTKLDVETGYLEVTG
jgi:hypothetical protein